MIQVHLVHAGPDVATDGVDNLRAIVPSSVEAQVGTHASSIADQCAQSLQFPLSRCALPAVRDDGRDAGERLVIERARK